jgi:hypothetical protein
VKKHRPKRTVIASSRSGPSHSQHNQPTHVTSKPSLPERYYTKRTLQADQAFSQTANTHLRNQRSASQIPLRQHHHNVRPEPIPVVGCDQQPGEPATGDTATARREESRRGQEPGRRLPLRLALRCYHEPCKPEAVFFQAEADQQVRISRYSMAAKEYHETNIVVSSIGMAATPPAAPSSPATCPPLRTPMKNPSRPYLLVSFLRANAAGSAKDTFTCTTTGR